MDVPRAASPRRLLARFVCAIVVTTGLLHLSLPIVAPALARLTRNLILVSTPVPVIGSVEWTGSDLKARSPLWDGLPLYRVASRTQVSVVTFSLALPLAAALALPSAGRRRGTVAWLCLAGVCVSTTYLALSLTANLDAGLAQRGLSVFSPGRTTLHGLVRSHGWPYCAILLPAAGSLWVASRSVLGAGPQGGAAEAVGRRGLVACTLALAALVVASEFAAQRRARPVTASEMLVEIEAWNPGVRAYLLEAAKQHDAAGRSSHAREALRLAARYDAARPSAARAR